MFCLWSFCKEVVVVGSVLEVCLKAECQLQKPLPLRLHGSKIGLDRVAGRVLSHNKLVATILNEAELTLTLL